MGGTEMSESISRVIEEKKSTVTSSDAMEFMSGKYGRSMIELMQVVKALSDSGILSIASSLLENYQDALSTITEELSDGRMENFIRNVSAVYTLLSRLPPEMVSSFMENAADEMTKGNREHPGKPMGLLSLNSLIKDPDVSSGMRILIGTMKGFTRKTGDHKHDQD
jgi:uncharacterized protein YjgD (DUF1641 family)